MLDAYTVRKAIPRILVAVIGINLSIYLCVILIDITNIIGNGINELISGPFVGDGIQIDSQNFTGNIATQGVLGVIFALIIKSVVLGPGVLAIIGSIFPLILIIGLVTLAVLFTLIIRQGLLLFLTVISPVAIALFVLPGTEKYFKKWWDLFIKTLMVYPIIAIFFAVSNAMVAIMLGQANVVAGPEQTVKLIAGIIVLYAPLVLIPFAFKLAGGAISQIMNAAQGATDKKRRGMSEGRAKSLGEAKALNKERIASGMRYKGGTANNWRGKLNRGLQTSSIVSSGEAGVNPLKMKGRMQANKSAVEYDAAQKAKENNMARGILVNDTLMNAVLHGNRDEASAREYLVREGHTGRQLEQELGMIRGARRAVGERALEIASAAALPGTKTAFTSETGDVEMLETAMRAANGDKTLQGLIYNEQRQNAMSAGRFDLGGYGFGAGLKAMDELEVAYASGNQTRIQEARIKASEEIQEDALTHLSGGQIMGGHGNSTKRMLAHANKRIDRAAEKLNVAHQSGDKEVIARADREFKQVLGLSANLLDMANAVGAENAISAADTHMNHSVTVNGKTMRISEFVEEQRTDPVFQQSRREMLGRKPSPEEIEAARKLGRQIDPQEGSIIDPTKPPY